MRRRVALGADVLTVVLSAGVVVWGVWLLMTVDVDGGRHQMGAFMVTAGAVVGLWAALSARRRRRHRT